MLGFRVEQLFYVFEIDLNPVNYPSVAFDLFSVHVNLFSKK